MTRPPQRTRSGARDVILALAVFVVASVGFWGGTRIACRFDEDSFLHEACIDASPSWLIVAALVTFFVVFAARVNRRRGL